MAGVEGCWRRHGWHARETVALAGLVATQGGPVHRCQDRSAPGSLGPVVSGKRETAAPYRHGGPPRAAAATGKHRPRDPPDLDNTWGHTAPRRMPVVALSPRISAHLSRVPQPAARTRAEGCFGTCDRGPALPRDRRIWTSWTRTPRRVRPSFRDDGHCTGVSPVGDILVPVSPHTRRSSSASPSPGDVPAGGLTGSRGNGCFFTVKCLRSERARALEHGRSWGCCRWCPRATRPWASECTAGCRAPLPQAGGGTGYFGPGTVGGCGPGCPRRSGQRWPPSRGVCSQRVGQSGRPMGALRRSRARTRHPPRPVPLTPGSPPHTPPPFPPAEGEAQVRVSALLAPRNCCGLGLL